MENYTHMDLSSWTKVGEGGNGATYENPSRPDVLLKLNIPGQNGLETVKREFDLSASVAKLGVPTPGMLEIVRVGDAYAMLMERIRDKKSIFRICHDQPERLEEMARLFCRLGKELAATPCDRSAFPSRKDMALEGLERSSWLGREACGTLRRFIEAIPESGGCVHGDFQPGNVILSGDRHYWIDLGRFAWGDPMFDIGHLYLSCVVYASQRQAQAIFHMNEQQLKLFWDHFAKAYTGREDHAAFDREAARFGAVDIVVRSAYVPASFLHRLFFRMHVKRLMKFF